MSERAAWVALSVVPGLGPSRFRRLLEAYGSPTSALKAGPEALDGGPAEGGNELVERGGPPRWGGRWRRRRTRRH